MTGVSTGERLHKRSRPAKPTSTKDGRGEYESQLLLAALRPLSRNIVECGGGGHCGPNSIQSELLRVTGKSVNVRDLACDYIAGHAVKLAHMPYIFDADSIRTTRSSSRSGNDPNDYVDVMRYVAVMRKAPPSGAAMITQVELSAIANALGKPVFVLVKGTQACSDDWRWVKYRGFGTVESYGHDGDGGTRSFTAWGIMADGDVEQPTQFVPGPDDIAIVNHGNVHFQAASYCMPSWTCKMCTFEHELADALMLCCKVCGADQSVPTGASQPQAPHLSAASSAPKAAGQLKVISQPKPRNIPPFLLAISSLVPNGIVAPDRVSQYVNLVNSASEISSISVALQSLNTVYRSSNTPSLLKELADNLLGFLGKVLCNAFQGGDAEKSVIKGEDPNNGNTKKVCTALGGGAQPHSLLNRHSGRSYGIHEIEIEIQTLCH